MFNLKQLIPNILLETTKKYLKTKKIKFDDFGLKTEYLFYR